jgi:hypothetical protein
MVNTSRRSEWRRSVALTAGPCVSLAKIGSRPRHGSSGWGETPLAVGMLLSRLARLTQAVLAERLGTSSLLWRASKQDTS